MKKRMIMVAILAVLVATVATVIYHLSSRQPPLRVTFLGFTNSNPYGITALFGVTNSSSRPVRRLTWEVHSGTGREMRADLVPVVLPPGRGERLEVPRCSLPGWRLAVLSSGRLKGAWNRLLTKTPYVARNQWELLLVDRSFSGWVVSPPPSLSGWSPAATTSGLSQ